MKPTNIIVIHNRLQSNGIEYLPVLMQWWSNDEGYGEWRDINCSMKYPDVPEGFKGNWEKQS